VDSDYAVIGAMGDTNSTGPHGKAFVFHRSSGDTWEAVAMLEPDYAEYNDEFGFAVDISGDQIIVGALGAGNHDGEASIFERTGSGPGDWTRVQTLSLSNRYDNHWFASSVGIDNGVAVMGAYQYDTPSTNCGAVGVFVRAGGTWPRTETQLLQASDVNSQDYFGRGVDIKDHVIVVGAPQNDDGASNNGTSYIFGLNASTGDYEEKHILQTAGSIQLSGYMGAAVTVDVVGGNIRVLTSGTSHQTGGISNSGRSFYYETSDFAVSPPIWGDTCSKAIGIRCDDRSRKYQEDYTVSSAYSNQASGSTACGADGRDIWFNLDTSNISNGDTITATLLTEQTSDFQVGILTGCDPDADCAATDTMEAQYTYTSGNIYILVDGGLGQFTLKILISTSGITETIFEIQRLDNPIPLSGDYFSYALDISGDWAIFGAGGQDDPTDGGAIYFYQFDGYEWSFISEHRASDAGNQDHFGGYCPGSTPWTGGSVAISGDWAMAGAHENDQFGTNRGAVYVFNRSGTVWSESQIIYTDEIETAFPPFTVPNEFQLGTALAMDGDNAVLGAGGRYLSSSTYGKAFIYSRNGTVWEPDAMLEPESGFEQVGDNFGWAVDISGVEVIIGANNHDNHTGTATVFEYITGTWTLLQTMTLFTGTDNDYFGYTVGIDSGVAVAGAYQDDTPNPNCGTVSVFTKSGGVWPPTESQLLTASDANGADYFGRSVAIEGDYIIVGAPQNDEGESSSGSAYIFEYNINTLSWEEVLILGPERAGNAGYMGMTCALDYDGSDYRIFTSGTSYQPLELSNCGRAFYYGPSVPVVIPTGTPTGLPTITPTPGPCIHDGDVNQNGFVTSGDAQLAFWIALFMYTPTYDERCAADCNGDGTVSAGDAQQIFQTALFLNTCADPI